MTKGSMEGMPCDQGNYGGSVRHCRSKVLDCKVTRGKELPVEALGENLPRVSKGRGHVSPRDEATCHQGTRPRVSTGWCGEGIR